MRKLKNSELNRLSVEKFKESSKISVTVVLDNIRSLNNIGSIFRTSDSFLVEKIALCGITASPPHREIHKTALGATDSVDWKYFDQTRQAITELKASGYQIIAVEQMDHSIPLGSFKYYTIDKIALVFGNEVKGISDDIVGLIDTCIEIPQFGTKHSLNVSVTAGIVLWHIYNSALLSK